MDGEALNTVGAATSLPGAPGTPILPVEPLELDLAHVQGVPAMPVQDNAGLRESEGQHNPLRVESSAPAPKSISKRTADGGIIVASPQHRRLLHARTVRRYLRGFDSFRSEQGKLTAATFLPERLKARRVPRANQPGRKPEHEQALREYSHLGAITRAVKHVRAAVGNAGLA